MSNVLSAAPSPPTSPWELLRVFNRLTLQGFGGVLPVAQREIVDRARWMDKASFLQLLALGQVLPGPNIVNFALIYGDRCFGWRGALAALTGLLAAPLLIVLALTLVYARYGAEPVVAGALRGMGVVAAGLIGATALKLLPALKRNLLGRTVVVLLVVATVLLVGVLRWPLWLALLVLALPVMAWAWRVISRQGGATP